MKKPDYNHSIINVTSTFLKHYGIDSPHKAIDSLSKELEGINHVIYILLDGLGVNVIKKHLHKNDALYRYMADEITSVFPPTTVAATTSVLSNKLPISSGHLGWVQYFKEEDTNLVVFMNTDYYTNEPQQENLKEKYLNYTNITTMIQNETGIESTIFFPSFQEGGSNSFHEEVERVLLKTHHTDKSFNYLYWTEPDLSEHKYGVYSKEVKDVLVHLNQDFTELIQNITNDTLVCLIADHGLTDVSEVELNDYSSITSLLTRKPSLEPRCVNFFIKEGKKELFKIEFNKLFKNDFQLYTKQEFLDTGLLGTTEKHRMVDSFLGDYIAIAKTDKMFIFDQSKGYKGHHAGLSEDEMIVPLIIYKKQENI
jgi:predicted AlkP superfamily pyrophosphatase or phosphodiesterase